MISRTVCTIFNGNKITQMTCKYTPKDIGRYLFNQMTLEEETEFQFHLSQCNKCRSELQAIRDLADGLKEDNDTCEQISGKIQPPKSRLHLRPFYIAAVIILLCCLGIVFYFRSGDSQTKQGFKPDTYLYQDSVFQSIDSTATIKKDTV